MNIITRRRIGGVTLIEALIALVVIALGLLAIARFYGELVSSSGLSKARTEAVQLANTRIEALRLRALGTDICGTPLADWEDPNSLQLLQELEIQGTNALFTLNPVVTQQGSVLVADVTVSWFDRANENEPTTVALQSLISCDNPTLSVRVDDDNLPDGNFVRSPVGKAERGGVLLGDPETDQNIADITPLGLPDNLQVIRSDDNTTQLVFDDPNDGTGPTALLTMRDSTGDGGFSTVSGKVFFYKPSFGRDPFGTGKNQVNVPDVRLLATQGAECVKAFADGVIVAEGFAPQPSPGEDGLFDYETDSDYPYFEYYCFLGEGWYGNIGVVRLDEAGGDQGVCVGDPDPSENDPFDKRDFLYNVLYEPANFRKYHPDVCESRDPSSGECVSWTAVGAGLIFVESNAGEIEITGYQAQRIGGFNSSDFLLVGGLKTRLSQRRDGCSSAMGDGALFSGNLGEYFCLTGECEGVADAEPVGSIIQGMISFVDTTDPAEQSWALRVNDVDNNPEIIEEACSSIVEGEDWSYKCELSLPGYTGVGEWTGGFAWPGPSTLKGAEQSDTLDYQLTVGLDGGTVDFVGVPIGETAIVDLDVE